MKNTERMGRTNEIKDGIRSCCGKVMIKMSDYYPEHTGEEYIEVSSEVYEQLCIERRREKMYERRDYLHIFNCGFDENIVGEVYGIYGESAEDRLLGNIKRSKLYEALSLIDPVYAKRLYLYFGVGMKAREIAEIEGVSHAAVFKSVNKGLEALRPLLSKKDFE